MEKSKRFGKRLKQGLNVVIGEDVEIGENVEIGTNTIIMNGVIIGNNVKIGDLCIIGAEPNVREDKNNEYGKLQISDFCVIKSNVVICKAFESKKRSFIGFEAFVGYGAYIAHNCKIGAGVVISPQSCIGGNVSIGEKTNLGTNSFVHQGLNIGKFCMVGAQTKVVRDIPNYALVSEGHGEVKGINKIGMKRSGISDKQIRDIEKIFNILYDLLCEKVTIDVSAMGIDTVLYKEIEDCFLKSVKGCTRRKK